MAPSPLNAPLGIYLHIPFCRHICPYCDFNTYSGQSRLLPRYIDSLISEIESISNLFGRRAVTVFFGGGTPSQLSPGEVRRLIVSCRKVFDLPGDAEITLESNPNDLDEARCLGYLEAGVNRLSMGAQTLDRKGLRVLGRQHESTDTLAAFTAAREAGFRNISLDFIFGWPGQSLQQWQSDLSAVLSWPNGGPDHLSLYNLIIEPGTPMHESVKRQILTPADDDLAADMYEAAIETLATAGWLHYEIANWATSKDLQSQHNRIYWRNGEYAGFGAGAYGRIGDQRTMKHLLPLTYIESMEQGEPPISNIESISDETARSETMMLGLRLLDDGIEEVAFFERHNVALHELYGAEINTLQATGLLERNDGRLRLTRRGLMMANDVCSSFV